MANFTVVDDGTIRFGLAAIKGVGAGKVNELLEIREKGGAFKDIEDFTKRVPYNFLNKKTLEALGYAGALDDLGERKALVASIEDISRHARLIQTTSAQGQTDIFSMLTEEEAALPPFVLADVPEASPLQRLQWEKEFLGFYVSGHPLQGLRQYLRRKVNLIESIDKKLVGKSIKLAGILTSVKKIFTKSGSQMAYLTLEDPTGRLEITIFPNTFAKFKDLLTPESVVTIAGKVEFRRGQFQILAQTIQGVSLETMISKSKQAKLYNPEERVSFVSNSEPEPESEPESKPEPELKPESAKKKVAPKTPPPTIEDLVITMSDAEASSEQLLKLKELLLRHQGKQRVEIQIKQAGMVKRIKVPFGVAVSDDLKSQIAEMATII